MGKPGLGGHGPLPRHGVIGAKDERHRVHQEDAVFGGARPCFARWLNGRRLATVSRAMPDQGQDWLSAGAREHFNSRRGRYRSSIGDAEAYLKMTSPDTTRSQLISQLRKAKNRPGNRPVQFSCLAATIAVAEDQVVLCAGSSIVAGRPKFTSCSCEGSRDINTHRPNGH